MTTETTSPADPGASTGTMPALYIGHGAPPLLDDPIWSGQLRSWAADLPRPRAIVMVSAPDSTTTAISSGPHSHHGRSFRTSDSLTTSSRLNAR